MFKILEKNNVTDILETLNKHGKTEFSEISEKFEVSKSYMSRLLLEMEEEGLLFRTEEKKGKKIPIPSYELTEIGIRSLRIYTNEKIFRELIHKIDEILSKKYKKITTFVSLEIDTNRFDDLGHNRDYYEDKLNDAYARVDLDSDAANDEITNALTVRLIPSLAYQYSGKDDILYIFFEDREIYEFGDSIYKEINGTVARIREIYGKTYLFLNNENLDEILHDLTVCTYEEIPGEHQFSLTPEGPDDDLELKKGIEQIRDDAEGKIQIRKKEMFERLFKESVVKSAEEIAERIIKHIENLK